MADTPPFRLLIPVTFPFFITDRFNAARNYTFAPNKLQLHEGIDLAPRQPITVPLNVRAAQRGIVDKVGFAGNGYGHYVRIVHDWFDGSRYVTWYGHLAQPATVRENQFVTAGHPLGIAGSTGFSTGIHLHLTLQHLTRGRRGYVVDDVIDPEPFFADSLDTFDEAWWVADVTIPDNSVIEPGATFRKTWRVRNAGSTTWGQGYTLVFFADNPMNGPASVALPAASPGDEVEVSVDLTAPTQPGRHRSTWTPKNAAGVAFAHEQFVDIDVRAPVRPVAAGFSEARFFADVTIPDGTPVKPGDRFRKTWRIRNSGQTTWDANYRLAFFSGDSMNGPTDGVPLPVAVPGQMVDVSLDLTAPQTLGLHRSTWKPQDPSGQFFEFEMYTEVHVIASAQTDNGEQKSSVLVLAPGQTIRYLWRLRNAGQTRWSDGYTLALVTGERIGTPQATPLPAAKPGDEIEVVVSLTAATQPGEGRAIFRLRAPNGNLFGPELVLPVRIVV